MIVIVAKNTLKPGKAEEFKAAAAPLIEGTRAEAGNISYELYADIADPNVFTFIEKWQDEAAIESHFAAPHFKAAGPVIDGLAAAPMDLTQYRLEI
ncbi:MAG: antibiotic biosynthesis monooxygenase [Clostridiales Family XIII bacterium]|jgi:quinol monooxygenase YgiN|nr:antibiotic biosynthesis monooxygenase [Clostridiales Family XIII bacterium]